MKFIAILLLIVGCDGKNTATTNETTVTSKTVTEQETTKGGNETTTEPMVISDGDNLSAEEKIAVKAAVDAAIAALPPAITKADVEAIVKAMDADKVDYSAFISVTQREGIKGLSIQEATSSLITQYFLPDNQTSWIKIAESTLQSATVAGKQAICYKASITWSLAGAITFQKNYDNQCREIP